MIHRKKFFSPCYVDAKFLKRVLSDAVLSELSFGGTLTGLACQFILKKWVKTYISQNFHFFMKFRHEGAIFRDRSNGMNRSLGPIKQP